MLSPNEPAACLTVLLVLFLVLPVAHAQFGGMNAEFAGGGARPLAMGGAFIALADDATASEFNPAGLWQLRRSELALQGIHTWDERTVGLPWSSFAEGEAVLKEHTDRYWIPSFASFVYATQWLAIGLSEFTNIYYDRAYTDPEDGTEIREKAVNTTFGVTLASKVVERLTVGTTLRHGRFEYEFSAKPHSDAEDFSSGAWSAHFGLLCRFHRKFHIGAVYKTPQKIDGDYRGLSVDTELPETIGFGAAFLPDDRWRLLLDVDRVRWSRFDPNPQDQYHREDVWRYHVGAEWHAGTWGQTALYLRSGFMREDSNALRYRGDNEILNGLTVAPDSINHYTSGFGLAWPHWQLDFGFDYTEDSGRDLIGSVVVYF